MWQRHFKISPMKRTVGRSQFFACSSTYVHGRTFRARSSVHTRRRRAGGRAGEKRAPRPRRRLRNARNGIPRSQLRSHPDLTRPYSGLVVIASCLFATTTTSVHLYAFARTPPRAILCTATHVVRMGYVRIWREPLHEITTAILHACIWGMYLRIILQLVALLPTCFALLI